MGLPTKELSAFKSATHKTKTLVRKAFAEEGVQFYLDMAKDASQTPQFRKACWDTLREMGFGRPGTQKDTGNQARKKILVTRIPSRKDLTYASYQEDQLPQANMAEEEQDEPDDQAEME